MIKEIISTADIKMNKSISVLKKELASMKAGRANPAMLDRIEALYYDIMTPLNQLANISAPEPRVLLIQPWDKNSLKEIERSILKSDLGINPSNDGIVIRLIVPELTEETRKSIVKAVKKAGEETKVAIRSIRKDSNDKIKHLKNVDEISEDDIKKAEEKIQDETDKFIRIIDVIVEQKEKEIMSI